MFIGVKKVERGQLVVEFINKRMILVNIIVLGIVVIMLRGMILI